MNVTESSLFASFSSVNRYNARDIADLTFLYFITLHVLRVNWHSAPLARQYAQRTMSHGGWEDPYLEFCGSLEEPRSQSSPGSRSHAGLA